MPSPVYRLKKVDGFDDEVAAEIRTLHDATFGDCAPQLVASDFEVGDWWLVYFGKETVGFGGLLPSRSVASTGYLARSGVMPEHRGKQLQLRLVRAREKQAKRKGWQRCVSDTTDNLASANTLIKAGYSLWRPKSPWGFDNTLYWQRSFDGLHRIVPIT